jgi:hypothetical protein
VVEREDPLINYGYRPVCHRLQAIMPLLAAWDWFFLRWGHSGACRPFKNLSLLDC